MENLNIPATAIHTTKAGEARILDTDLASWLGMEAPRNIRATISANYLELQAYGNLHGPRANPGKPGRPASAYFLNEGQALVLCALARTERAAYVRKALINLFTAYRQGKTVQVKAHKRRPPQRVKIDLANFNGEPVLVHEGDDTRLLLNLLARVEWLEAQAGC